MIITWKGAAQHMDFGLVKPGDVIDTTALGIPDETVKPWLRDGDAVETKTKKPAKESGKEA